MGAESSFQPKPGSPAPILTAVRGNYVSLLRPSLAPSLLPAAASTVLTVPIFVHGEILAPSLMKIQHVRHLAFVVKLVGAAQQLRTRTGSRRLALNPALGAEKSTHTEAGLVREEPEVFLSPS